MSTAPRTRLKRHVKEEAPPSSSKRVKAESTSSASAPSLPQRPLFQVPIELKSMSQLVKDRPHLALTEAGEPVCDDAKRQLLLPTSTSSSSSSSSSSSPPKPRNITNVELQRRFWQQQPIDLGGLPAPSQGVLAAEYDAVLQNLRMNYPRFPFAEQVVHKGECTSDNPIVQALASTPRVDMSMRTAQHEDNMLKESGQWYMKELGGMQVDFPGCSSGAKCVAASYWTEISGLDHAIILMASMDEDQYKRLLQEGCLMDPNHPDQPYSSLCVLCWRQQVHWAQVEHQRRVMDGDDTPLQQPGWQMNDPLSDNMLTVQPYYNLKEQAGGYNESCMLEANPRYQPPFQPIVSANLSLLTATQSLDDTRGELKRWVIDQSVLRYTSKSDAKPRLGERVQDFLNRSKKTLADETASLVEQASVQRRATLLKRSLLSLLLRHRTLYDLFPPPLVMDKGKLCIDRNACWTWAHEDEMPNPAASLACACLHDVVERDPNCTSYGRFVPWEGVVDKSPLWSSLVADRLIHPSAVHHTLQSAFFVPLTDVVTPLHYLISKCGVPARCNIRTLPRMICTRLIGMTRPTHDRQTSRSRHKDVWKIEAFPLHVVRHMVLCALLGNYSHSVHSSRPPAHVRAWLYAVFTQDRYTRFVMRLFEFSPLIAFVSIRCYVYWVLRSTPALWTQLRDMMRLEENQALNEWTLVKLRQCFVQLFDDKASPLHAQLRTLPPEPCPLVCFWKQVLTKKERHLKAQRQQQNAYSTSTTKSSSQARAAEPSQRKALEEEARSGWLRSGDALHQHLNDVALNGFREKYTELLYRRPKIQIIKELLPMRKPKDCPMVPLGGVHPPSFVFSLSTMQTGRHHEEGMKNNELYSEHVKQQSQPAIDKPGLYLTAPHVAALHELVAYCGPVGFGNPLPRLLQALPAFGVPDDMAQQVKDTFEKYQNGRLRKPQLLIFMWSLRCSHPYAYNLVHVIAELLERARRRIHTADLPLHITRCQLESIRRLHGLDVWGKPGRPAVHYPHNVVLDSSVSFVYCHVCFRIYSHINEINSVYKHTYVYGLRDVVVEYRTGKTYCSGSRDVNELGRGTCGSQELVRIPLLGRVLWFGSKVVMLCPQDKCGMIMAVDTKDEQYLHYNERGPACMSCTLRLTAPEHQSKQAERMVNRNKITCVLCGTNQPARMPKKAHMYEGDNWICHAHHSDQLRMYVASQMRMLGASNMAESDRSNLVLDALLNWPKAQQDKKNDPGALWDD